MFIALISDNAEKNTVTELYEEIGVDSIGIGGAAAEGEVEIHNTVTEPYEETAEAEPNKMFRKS